MRYFKDKTGQEWSFELTVDTIKSVKKALPDVNLLEALDGHELTAKLHMDVELLCNVLYVICREQAEKRNVTDEDFGKLMNGNALGSGLDALMNSLVDFCPSPRKRQTLGQILEKSKEMENKLCDLADEKVNLEMSRLLESAKSSFGDTQGSSVFIPAL